MDYGHADWYDAIKSYDVNNECVKRAAMWYLGMVWKTRK